MQTAVPATREIVMVGGGHAHALVLRSWGMNPLPGARLTVINPHPTAPYSGMLPGLIAGHYQQPELEIDLVRLARFAGARLVIGAASGLDRHNRLVQVAGRAPIYYDIASVDIGITTHMPDLPGFARHATPAKPLDQFVARWEAFVATAADAAGPVRVAVLGAGVAGVELALAARHRLTLAGAEAHVTLVEAAAAPLNDIGAGARRALTAQLAAQGVNLECSADVSQISESGPVLADGRVLGADFTIGAAGARPHGWLQDTGLALEKGYIRVGADLRCENDDQVFAVGDCAHLVHAPRPKAGVFAVRQAPVLLHNLRAAATGGRGRAYHPQRDYLKLISTGHKHAVADKFGLRLEGDLLWRWKNRIDTRFMRKFHDLPAMPRPQAPRIAATGVAEMMEGATLCGGCAAKLGQQGLNTALNVAGDDAALLKAGNAHLVISTDHFRAFWPDPWLVGRVAAVHALGDIWATGATPRHAVASVTLPRMAEKMMAHMLREAMAGARSVFDPLDVQVAGGHTAISTEFMLGFTLTGEAGTRHINHSGAKPGDAILLTKPLGTGVVFAAEMLAQADGCWVQAALASMAAPQQAAAQQLAGCATAMTDVTGFGLLGHLNNILGASQAGAVIDTASVPLLPGALALAQRGVRASLHAQNAGLLQGVASNGVDAAMAALLVDPQTAGGLLATIPDHEIAHKLAQTLGPGAAVIGEVTGSALQLR